MAFPQDRPPEHCKKTTLTAAVIIPPEPVWEPIQTIRRRHDRQIRRWMPHITLLYPFVPEEHFGEAAGRLAPVCQGLADFGLRLIDFGYFSHGKRSATLWRRPDSVESVRELQARMQEALPWCDDVSRSPSGFNPHLSVGQFRGEAEAERARTELGSSWEPICFRVEEVCLIARTGCEGEPFEVRRRLPLGPADRGREVRDAI